MDLASKSDREPRIGIRRSVQKNFLLHLQDGVCVLFLSFGIATAIAISLLIQFVLFVLFARALRQGPSTTEIRQTIEKKPPRICVIMPLRGADPFLKDSILSVVHSQYPNLFLQIIIDCEQDSARSVVEETLRDVSKHRYHVDFLRDHCPVRSLICSSILQAVDANSDHCDLFSFCAADMVLPADWYWHLVNAMNDKNVGCPLGNRWYQPLEGQWGSLIRQAWNAGAVVIMWLCEIPWGGAAALRPADIKQSGLYSTWQTSLVEDVTIYDAIRSIGKSPKFVPALTVVNQEEIDVSNGFKFIKRQMLWARLYHPRWWLVLGHALAGLSAIAIPTFVAIVALMSSQYLAAGVSAGAILVYIVTMVLLWVQLENCVARTVLLTSCEIKSHRTWTRLIRMTLVVPLVQVLYPIAAIACSLATYADWRGIRYLFLGRGKIRMVEYVPFAASEQPNDGKTSI